MRIIFLITMLVPFAANATSITSSAGVDVVTPLIMNQVREMSFGQVSIPPTGSPPNAIKVKKNGDYASGTTGVIGEFQESARFEIFGEPNTVVQFSEVSVNSTIVGVTFDNIIVSATKTIPNDGQRFTKIGGQISIDSTASAGVYDNGELTYTVSIEYQ